MPKKRNIKDRLHIGREISRVRGRNGAPQVDLAERIGMSPSNMTHLMTRENVDVHLLHDISKALKFNFFKLFQVDEGNGTDDDKDKIIERLTGQVVALEKQMEEIKRESDAVKLEMKFTRQNNEDLRQAHELLLAAMRPALKLHQRQARSKSVGSGSAGRLMIENG